jgi:hypothetical protein
VTDGNGAFDYVPTTPLPQCTFSVGGITLGAATVPPNGVALTPYDLVPGATTGNTTVANIARFLRAIPPSVPVLLVDASTDHTCAIARRTRPRNLRIELDGGGVPPGLLAPLGWAIEGKVGRVLRDDLLDLKHSVEG